MNKFKEYVSIKLFVIATLILLGDLLNGSQVMLGDGYMVKITLPTGMMLLLAFSVLIYSFGVIPKAKKVKKILISLILSVLFIFAITPLVNSYQYDRTKEKLELVCSEIVDFRIRNGHFPNNLNEIFDKVQLVRMVSYYSFFNNKIQYQLHDENNFRLIYKFRHGKLRESNNCVDSPVSQDQGIFIIPTIMDRLEI